MIATAFCKLFNEIIKRQSLNKSAKEAITSLMRKPGVDLLNVKHWRPISLLNNDYKLFAKVLVKRMEHVVPYLIGNEQKGFMKNRCISNNLLDLLTTVKWCQEYNIDAALIAIDFSHAFDSCRWPAIRATLNAYGYPDQFIDMIMICYNDVKTAIMNNNRWTKWINLKNGTRQGCPLSGMIFVHLISVLALKLKQNDQIRSVRIGSQNKLLDMFADDIWNCILFEQSSFDELIYEYDEFQNFSGLTINYNKTEVLRLGSIRNTDAKFYSQLPLHWSDGPIKILGLLISPDYNETIHANYQGTLQKIKNTLNTWKARDLSPIGKIQIVNTLANSQLIYKLQVLSPPKERFLVDYKKLIIDFVWNSKKPKIAYKRLIASFDQGGLQLRDMALINESLKLAKVLTILDDSKKFVWKDWFRLHFKVANDYLFRCNFSYKDIVKFCEDSLQKDVLSYWAKHNFMTPQSVNEILQQQIWYNSHIRFQNKWMFNCQMYQNRIEKIVDLYNLDTGAFYSYNEFCVEYPNVNINFLHYHRIIAAIPASFKRILRLNVPSPQQDEENIWQNKFIAISSKGKPSRELYKYLRDSEATDVSTLSLLWNNDLCTQLTPKKLGQIFIHLKHLVKSTKLRYFQYRILTRSFNFKYPCC